MRNHELAGLEPQTRRSLRVQAERDLARLSIPGAMVYFLIVLVVIFVTPYETDYPLTVLSVGCLMLLVGGGRLIAGKRLSASPAETLFRWKGGFRLLVFTQFFLWGLFCAVTVRLYGSDWTAMVVLFCSSALAGGGTSSLAPDNKLAARCMLAIMLPTSVVGAALATTETYTIAFLSCLYLAFLLVQAKQHGDAYWATSVAAALEATRESDKLFRAAFESAGIGMALMGTAGQFLRVNTALCEMFARSEKELHASDLESLSHRDDSRTSRGMLQRLTQGETRVHFEQRYVQKQGAVVWGSVTLSAVGSVQEEQRYFVMMVQDITERKRMEDALRESETRYRTLVETMRDGVGVQDEKGLVVYANDGLCEMFGYSREEIIGRPATELLDPASLNIFDRQSAAKTGRPSSYELALLRKDGERIHALISATPLFDAQSRPAGSFAVVTDITKRKHMEEALRWTQYSVDHAAEGVFWVRPDGGFVYVNDAAAHSLGYSREELLNLSVSDVDTAISSESWPAQWQRVKDEHSVTFESILRAKDGRMFPVEITANYMSLDGQEFHCAFVRDTTERKQAEEEQRKLATLVENSSDCVCLASLDGEMLYINPAGCDLVGFEASTLPKGTTIADHHPEETRARLRDLILPQVLKTGGWEGELQLLHSRTGEAIDVEGRMFLVRHPGNQEPICLAGVMRDIRQRKLAEEQRKKLEVQLQRSQKLEAVGVLAGGIAHDFNNILTAIYGFTFLTKETLPEEAPAQGNLDQILKASERARDLVQQILAFSRQRDEKRKEVEIAPLVREALKLLRASLPVSIEIREEIASDCGSVWADSTQIHQVVVNLCTNAYHAMRDSGGLLTVSLSAVEVDALVTGQVADLEQGSYVKLTVSDTGSGIAPDVQQRIFDPFFTTKAVGEGTGLGLSVVHGIVSSHDGAITFESAAGKGTKFFVYLPRVESGAAKQAAVDKPMPMGAEHVLFVDDEEAIVQFGQRVLEQLGYRVTTRTSSLEALDLFRDKPDRFDVVLCDVTMPTMSGIDLGIELMGIRSDVPVILMTGFSELVTKEKASRMGFRELVMKPFAVSDLAKTLRRVTQEGKTDN